MSPGQALQHAMPSIQSDDSRLTKLKIFVRCLQLHETWFSQKDNKSLGFCWVFLLFSYFCANRLLSLFTNRYLCSLCIYWILIRIPPSSNTKYQSHASRDSVSHLMPRSSIPESFRESFHSARPPGNDETASYYFTDALVGVKVKVRLFFTVCWYNVGSCC